eukprot:9504017-Pyramimonas_sp.AAC.2
MAAGHVQRDFAHSLCLIRCRCIGHCACREGRGGMGARWVNWGCSMVWVRNGVLGLQYGCPMGGCIGAVVWVCHIGCTEAVVWACHGCIGAVVWVRDGCIGAVVWVCHAGCTGGVVWVCHGCIGAVVWVRDGCTGAVVWVCHDGCTGAVIWA